MVDNKYKILVVEDDQFIRDLYVELLKDEGYKVDSGKNGVEGYEKMSKGGYDLVLLDIIMPKMDGMQVMVKLSENPPKKLNKHIIFMTNLGEDKTLNEGKKLGVESHLTKSDLTPDQFLEKVALTLK
ncbi:MAG: response regulator [bacterium]|nr:response regulator [bacterium]